MIRALKWAIILALLASPAHSQLTTTFVGPGSSKGASALVSCASTGILNLSNVCNDIYFLNGHW